MKRFLKLVRKDLETGRLPVLLLSGITLALMVWARLRLVNAPAVVETAESYWPSIYLVLALAVPVTFFPLWLIWRSVQTLRLEWRDDTIYTLLALPVPGWQIMLAKLVSLCMEYTVLFAVATGGALLLFGGVLNMGTALPGPSWVALNIFWLYLGGLLLFTALAVQTQLAVVVGKMVGRVQGIVTLWVWILAVWFTSRLAELLQPLFRWLPVLRLHELMRLDELETQIILEVHPAGQVGFWLATIGIFVLTGVLFERCVEVND